MDDIRRLLAAEGGVASAATFRANGIDRARMIRALQSGVILRVRLGWFASSGLSLDVIRAVRVGGRLSCISLLAQAGLWVIRPTSLHVSVARNTARLRSPDDPTRPLPPGGAVVHWADVPSLGASDAGRDSVEAAALHLVSCVPQNDAIVTLDSALNSGVISAEQVDILRAHAPAGKRSIFDKLDAGCQSGLETRVRLALAGRRLRVRTQVVIPGVGRVDVLVGDRLVIETDGAAFHTSARSREEDYRRDLALFALGYTVIRLSYAQVMYSWPETEASILRRIHAREHLWTASGRRRFHGEGSERFE